LKIQFDKDQANVRPGRDKFGGDKATFEDQSGASVLPVLDSVTKIPRDQYMRAQQGGVKHLH